MPKLIMIVHADKRTAINDVGKIVFEDLSGDRKKLLLIELNEPFDYRDYSGWGTRLSELRSKYYSLLALDPTKRAISIVVLP